MCRPQFFRKVLMDMKSNLRNLKLANLVRLCMFDVEKFLLSHLRRATLKLIRHDFLKEELCCRLLFFSGNLADNVAQTFSALQSKTLLSNICPYL